MKLELNILKNYRLVSGLIIFTILMNGLVILLNFQNNNSIYLNTTNKSLNSNKSTIETQIDQVVRNDNDLQEYNFLDSVEIKTEDELNEIIIPSSSKITEKPSNPSSNFVEDYIDSVNDKFLPSDNGSYSNWTNMQNTDNNFNTLAEEAFPQVLDTNWNSPSSSYSYQWYNINNIYSSDDSYARVSESRTNRRAEVYDFDIPTLKAEEIKGIEVSVEGYRVGTVSLDISLMYNTHSSITTSKSIPLTISETSLTIGSSTDLWGRTFWNNSDFTNTNFGIRLTGSTYSSGRSISVDHIQVKIHYQKINYKFDREFSFEDVAEYDESHELSIKTGSIDTESLDVEVWNSSSTSWQNVMSLTDSDDNIWKNVSIDQFIFGSTMSFRFIGSIESDDFDQNTWEIDSILMRYKLCSRHFLRRKNITIDHTKVSGTLADFPLLINIFDSDLANNVQSDADDIIFAKFTGEKLAHEIEYFDKTFNSSHSHLIAWVKVPQITSITDLTISIYYDNSSITNQENSSNTWKDSYQTIHHLEEDPTTNIEDSTSNSYILSSDGVMLPEDLTTAIIGDGLNFDGIDDNLISTDNINISDSFTFSFWFNSNTLDILQGLITINSTVDQPGDYLSLTITDNNVLSFNTSTDYEEFSTITSLTWYHTYLVYNDTSNTLKLYINGTQVSSTRTISILPILEKLQIACWKDQYFFDGIIDELRISNNAETEEWILTEYNNQEDPNSFSTLSKEEHMIDLDAPEIIDFGVNQLGNGSAYFWASIIDDYSGIANVTLKVNSSTFQMIYNNSNQWIHLFIASNLNDNYDYQIQSVYDNAEHQTSPSTEKNVIFDLDTEIPYVVNARFYNSLGPFGTFNSNVTDNWGIIDIVTVNVTSRGVSAILRETISGFINDTLVLSSGIFEYVIIVSDTVGNSFTSSIYEGVSYIGNTAPYVENLTLTPLPTKSNDTLYLDYDFYDVDGHNELGSEIRWYKNGILQKDLNDTMFITDNYLIKTDIWNATVKPYDGRDFGSLEASSKTIIQNSAPELLDFKVLPITPYTTEDLICNYTYFDNDNDLENIIIREILWYKNNIHQALYDNQMLIPNTITNKSEDWSFSVRVSDNITYSSWFQSNNITIVNSIPLAFDLIITVDPETNDDLEALWSFEDIDDDSEYINSWLILWYRNNVLQSHLNNSKVIGSSNTSKGELWYYTLQVYDGEDYSILYTLSPSINILNTQPIASNLIITQNPYTTTTIVAIWDYYDLNGDIESSGWRILWYKDGILQSELNNSDTVDTIFTGKGEEWYFSLLVFDGTDYSNLVISNITTVLNSVPEIDDFNIPEFVIEDQELNITYIFNDFDLDSDQTQIRWYRNETLQSSFNDIQFISADNIEPGEIWRVEVTPYDGFDYGDIIISENINIESRPTIVNQGFISQTSEEGYFFVWIEAYDNINDGNELTEIELIIYIEELDYTLPRILISSTNGTNFFWVYDDLQLLDILLDQGLEKEDFQSLIGTDILIEITATTVVEYSSIEHSISKKIVYEFTIEDDVAPRVTLLDYYWDNAENPTEITFYAEIEEFGLGIDEIILLYYFRSASENPGSDLKLFILSSKFSSFSYELNEIDMLHNSTHYYITLDFAPKEDYEIIFNLSVVDEAGNSNDNAYPLGEDPQRIDRDRFIFKVVTEGLPLEILLVAALLMIIISAVAIRKFSKTEIIGFDVDEVIDNIKKLDLTKIPSIINEHTLGVIVAFFDQRLGPVPILVEPEILKDNINKLIELSDLSFSATRFMNNFEDERPSNFDFQITEDQWITSLTFSFSLNRPDARGGAENITLNIMLDKSLSSLVVQFQENIKAVVHDIHILMDNKPDDRKELLEKVIKLREYISCIVLSYIDLYGSLEYEEE